MNLDAYTLIGFIGAIVLLVAFLLNQLGHWETTDFEYDFINLIGAALMTIYGWQISSWPIIILFAVWTVFSLKDVVFDGIKNMRKKKSAKADKGMKKELNKEHDSMESEMHEEE